MSLLLKALKQSGGGHAPGAAGRGEPALELEPPVLPPGAQAQEWVEPPGLLLGSSGLSRASTRRRLRLPQLSIVPLTALAAGLVAVGYGVYLYFALQPPAPLKSVVPALAPPAPPAAQIEEPAVAPPPEVAMPAPASAAVEATGVEPATTPVAAPHDAAAKAPRAPRTREEIASPDTGALSFQADVAGATLQKAYAAYQSGNLGEAQRLYARAAARERSIDAVLGLATLAAAQHRDDEAARLYREVLVRDPRNATAQAALLDLLGNTDRQATESQLKLLIERAPEAALYQTLGNLYAEQNRWSEAQAAYFEAWRGAPENADYAFNLAVSLDRLRQPQAALGYYEKALALGGAPRFERAQAEARVRQIRSSLP